MAVKTRKWYEIYNNLDALTQDDRDEIALKAKIIGQILETRKEKGLVGLPGDINVTERKVKSLRK